MKSRIKEKKVSCLSWVITARRILESAKDVEDDNG